MKNKILTLVLLIYCNGTFAQIPSWVWAKSVGGSDYQAGKKTATDSDGNVYLTGGYQNSSINYSGTNLSNSGSEDIFIAKYNSNGDVLWVKRAGGSNSDISYGIACDLEGNVYLAGTFSSSSIIFGNKTLSNTGSSGSGDIFIVKYNPAGDVKWAKKAGGTMSDICYDLAIDDYGNLLLTGYFRSNSITFGLTTLNNTTTTGYSEEIFVAKYDTSGNVKWAKKASGANNDTGKGIAADQNGNVYVTGTSKSSTLTFGLTTLTNSLLEDIFLAKYDSSGKELWAKRAGGTNSDEGFSVTCDLYNNAIITGYFKSTSVLFETQTINNSNATDETGDVYIVKYNPFGDVLWAVKGSGSSTEQGNTVVCDIQGNIYAAGEFGSSTLTFAGTSGITKPGISNIFLTKLNSSGVALWAASIGGTTFDYASNINIDLSGNIFLTGGYDSPSVSFGTSTLTNTGYRDIYLAKLNSSVGISENNNNSDFELFPSPSGGSISINIPENIKLLQVLNLSGSIIYEKANPTAGMLTINIGTSGYYFAKVISENTILTRKFCIIQ